MKYDSTAKSPSLDLNCQCSSPGPDTSSITLGVYVIALCLSFPISKMQMNICSLIFLWELSKLNHVKHLEICLAEKGYPIHFYSLRYNLYTTNAQVLSVNFVEFWQMHVTHVTISPVQMEHNCIISESSLAPLPSHAHPHAPTLPGKLHWLFFPPEISSDKWIS